MLEAGKKQFWEELVVLEQDRSKLLSSIDITKADKHLVPILREIHRCDEELREKLDAWMKHARTFLHKI